MQREALLQTIAAKVNANDLVGASAACEAYLALASKPNEQTPARIWQGVIALRRDNASLALGHFEAAYPFAKQDAQLLQQMAIAHTRLGNHERAENLYRSAIRIAPHFAAAHYNLGTLLQERREFVGARRAFEAALARAPALAVAHTNLANTLVALGDDKTASTHYRHALAIDDNLAEAHHGLGLQLQKNQDKDGAEQHFRRALALSPLAYGIVLDLAELLYSTGRGEEAVTHVEDVLASETAGADIREAAAFKLAQYRGESGGTMPRAMVEKLYAGMAGTFEEHLVTRLGYRVPELLMEHLSAWLTLRTDKPAVLDLGCGTGLFGTLVRPHARTLTGVDLSADMLDRARARNIYTTLTHQDAVQYLGDTNLPPARFDLIVATDVLIYIAPLPPLFEAVARALAAGGRFAFSTETPSTLTADFLLQPSGRYAHRAAYVETLANAVGLQLIEKIPTVIRVEAAKPIDGFVFVFQAPITSA
jgi:predicted TPR repeat methyltransferase